MPRNMYSVRDSKAETWSFPFQSDNHPTAIRDFTTLVNDGRTLVGQHPEDFDLYFVGTFNLQDGSSRCETPLHLSNGKELVREVQH